MIGFLRGTVRDHMRGTVLVEVAGVGYQVSVSADTLTTLKDGQTVELWTHLAVRENSQELFGFVNRSELVWFELLLTVPGVGPRSALAILSSVDTATLQSAIARKDAATLALAHGIGKKTAEKIVLELREKVGSSDAESPRGADADVIAALMALGYSQKEAREALRAIPAGTQTTEEKIREAIKVASSG